MVIFDRIGRDSDCSFINRSSEKKFCPIWRSPLGQANRNTQPSSGKREILQKSKCLSSKNEIKPPLPPLHSVVTPTCIFVIQFMACRIFRDNFWVTLACECPARHTTMAMQWNEKLAFSGIIQPQSPLDATVQRNWRWCRKSMGKKPPCTAQIPSGQIKYK